MGKFKVLTAHAGHIIESNGDVFKTLCDSREYPTLDELKSAIDSGEIKMKKVSCFVFFRCSDHDLYSRAH